MKINLLNEIIEVQKCSVTKDGYGNHKNAWAPYLFCHATVSGEAPAEDTGAGFIVDDSRLDLTIRYCGAAAAITSTEYRVLFNNELYDIVGIDHLNYKRKAIKLRCRKARR